MARGGATARRVPARRGESSRQDLQPCGRAASFPLVVSGRGTAHGSRPGQRRAPLDQPGSPPQRSVRRIATKRCTPAGTATADGSPRLQVAHSGALSGPGPRLTAETAHRRDQGAENQGPWRTGLQGVPGGNRWIRAPGPRSDTTAADKVGGDSPSPIRDRRSVGGRQPASERTPVPWQPVPWQRMGAACAAPIAEPRSFPPGGRAQMRTALHEGVQDALHEHRQ